MKPWLLGLLALGAIAAEPRVDAKAAPPAASVSVDVVKSASQWTADYRFGRKAPAWIFRHSALTRRGQKPWRPGSWTVLTPGVRIERRGWYDVLVADRGDVPRRVRIRFTPFGGDVTANYDPALVFTDGSTALFSDQFDVLPLASAAEADKLPLDLSTAKVEDVGTRVIFRDGDGKLFAKGWRHASLSLQNGRTYVLFGKAEPLESEHISTIIDPQLPAWLSRELATATPLILAYYTDRLGPRAGAKPMLMVNWAGPTPRRRSMGGSVLPSLVLMTFEGEGVAHEDVATRHRANWFIAHEAAHFWLGETVRHEYDRDAWISEGGADLLAVRTIASLDPQFDHRKMLQSLLDECVSLSAGKAVATAAERNQHRAYYACGAMFGLVAEAVQRRAAGGDFFTFVRTLIDANREDGVVTEAEWLAELSRVSKDPSLSESMRTMIDKGVPDPEAALGALFGKAGVSYSRAADGKLLIG